MSASAGADWMPYQYVVVRCVPRVEREEFVNVGVVLHCPEADFIGARFALDDRRLRALDATLDVDAVAAAVDAVARIVRGTWDDGYGVAVRATAYGTREVREDAGTRFGLVKAPRSTVVQPGPVRGGLTRDPAATLEHLVAVLVG